MMVKSKRLVVVLLVMMGVLFGCGEDDLGGVAKVTGTLPAIGSRIGTEGVLVVTFDNSSNIEKGIITVTVHERGSLANGPSVPLVNNQATINYSGLVSGKVTTFIISWKNTAGTVSTVNASFQVDEKKLIDKEPKKRIIWEKDNAKMSLISAGSFEMGDSKDEPEVFMEWSRPMHTVELDAFYMDIYEVTVGKFKDFIKESEYNYIPKHFQGKIIGWNGLAKYSPSDDHPMIYVGWHDATAYAEWAGKRLPTEAEWEYAASGGLIGKRYPWGNEITHDRANYYGTRGRDKWDWQTAPVGSFDANGYGLYDMAGNVDEWCSDWYDEDYYSNSPLRNPQGPSTSWWRVLRGGSWFSSSNYLRVACRINDNPTYAHSYFGFRCVSGFPTAEQ